LNSNECSDRAIEFLALSPEFQQNPLDVQIALLRANCPKCDIPTTSTGDPAGFSDFVPLSEQALVAKTSTFAFIYLPAFWPRVITICVLTIIRPNYSVLPSLAAPLWAEFE
jgi:hypothetical protein